MIEELTKEQEALLPVYMEKWLKIGLSCEPLDFEKAKKAACLAYKNAGLEEPKLFFRFESPLSAAYGALLLEKGFNHSENPEVDSKELTDKISDMVFGNNEAAWLSFYSFAKDVLGIKECSKLDGLFDLAENCGWWAPYENMVVFQDRPQHILFDQEKRLHCENGPAILYRDGFSVYSWHGIRVKKDWIETKKIDIKTLMSWPNIEERRAGCEIIGWDKVLSDLNSKIIDADKDLQIGILLEADLPGSGFERFLKVRCGTGRDFVIPVPRGCKSAREANAWTYGVDIENFNLEVRT